MPNTVWASDPLTSFPSRVANRYLLTELSLFASGNESSVMRLRLATPLGEDVGGSLAQTVVANGNEETMERSVRNNHAAAIDERTTASLSFAFFDDTADGAKVSREAANRFIGRLLHAPPNNKPPPLERG